SSDYYNKNGRLDQTVVASNLPTPGLLEGDLNTWRLVDKRAPRALPGKARSTGCKEPAAVVAYAVGSRLESADDVIDQGQFLAVDIGDRESDIFNEVGQPLVSHVQH